MIFRKPNCASFLTYTPSVYGGVFWGVFDFDFRNLESSSFLQFAPSKWPKIGYVCVLMICSLGYAGSNGSNNIFSL